MKSRARNQSGTMQKLTPVEEVAVQLWTKIDLEEGKLQRKSDWYNPNNPNKRKYQNAAERTPKKSKPVVQVIAPISDQDSN